MRQNRAPEQGARTGRQNRAPEQGARTGRRNRASGQGVGTGLSPLRANRPPRGSPAYGRFEARRLGLALGAEPAFATGLLNAAAVVVGRPGQHVDAAFAGDEAFDRAAVRRAALGLVP